MPARILHWPHPQLPLLALFVHSALQAPMHFAPPPFVLLPVSPPAPTMPSASRWSTPCASVAAPRKVMVALLGRTLLLLMLLWSLLGQWRWDKALAMPLAPTGDIPSSTGLASTVKLAFRSLTLSATGSSLARRQSRISLNPGDWATHLKEEKQLHLRKFVADASRSFAGSRENQAYCTKSPVPSTSPK